MTKNPHDHLHGLSPRARNKHNLNVISEYLFRVGYSTPDLMKSLIGNKDPGWFTDAIKRKDFQKVSTGVYEPSFVMVLTERTLRIAEFNAKQLTPYLEIDSGRINQATIRHNLLVQDLTLRSMKSGAISGYLTEREITVGGERGVKRPDVVWLPKTGGRIAVEVELTAKWARHFDEFVSGILTALNPPSGHPSYDKFCVITESTAIFNRYSQGMAADQPLNTWKKDSSGLWKIVKKGTVPDWLSERVSFRLVKST